MDTISSQQSAIEQWRSEFSQKRKVYKQARQSGNMEARQKAARDLKDHFSKKPDTSAHAKKEEIRMSTSVDTIVEKILKAMPTQEKVAIKFSEKASLIQYLHNWGRHIRNTYNLWGDPALVKATGTDHPDDASMVIMEKVWDALQTQDDVTIDPDCPQKDVVYANWVLPYTPICEACGLPYFKATIGGWVHPYQRKTGEWIGLSLEKPNG